MIPTLVGDIRKSPYILRKQILRLFLPHCTLAGAFTHYPGEFQLGILGEDGSLTRFLEDSFVGDFRLQHLLLHSERRFRQRCTPLKFFSGKVLVGKGAERSPNCANIGSLFCECGTFDRLFMLWAVRATLRITKGTRHCTPCAYFFQMFMLSLRVLLHGM